MSINEELARTDYARWFVREHFLRKDYDAWALNNGIERQRYLDILTNNGMVYPAAASRVISPFHHPVFVNIVDLVADEIDENFNAELRYVVEQCREDYQRYRAAHMADQYWQWLVSEAEYNRVYNEALVRSYGVDVKAP